MREIYIPNCCAGDLIFQIGLQLIIRSFHLLYIDRIGIIYARRHIDQPAVIVGIIGIISIANSITGFMPEGDRTGRCTNRLNPDSHRLIRGRRMIANSHRAVILRIRQHTDRN